MPPTRYLLRSACLAAGLVVALGAGTVGPASTAAADETDGTLTVIVARDVDGNGSFDPDVDLPQSRIGITVSDSAGHTARGVTDDKGTFELTASSKLSGGHYFVVAEIPDSLGELTPVSETADFRAMSTTVDVASEGQTVRMGVAARSTPNQAQAPAPPDSAPPAVPELDSEPAKRADAPRFAVGDLVWQDGDKSGLQESGRPIAAPATVQLLDANGDIVRSTKTSPSGHYAFDQLPAGTYSVRFAGIPTGFAFAAAARGSEPARDSDPDYAGASPPFTLRVGEANVRPTTPDDHVAAAYINSTIDAGVTPVRFAVADQVWLDLDRDGLRSSDEPGAAAQVTLLAAGGTQLASTRTDDQGRYQFTDLQAGYYRLRFVPVGAHRALTRARVGDDPATDSDPSPADGLTPIFRLDQNAPDLVPATGLGAAADLVDATRGAGLVGSYSIGDTVWRDVNGDVMLDAGDPGVKGVRVDLLQAGSRRVVAHRTTTSSGRFSFNSLPAGSYQLRFTHLPAGLVFVPQHVGGDPAADSDADEQGLTSVIALGDQDPADAAVDAGLTTPANLRLTAGTNAVAEPRETVLSRTGGVAAGLPVGAAIAVLVGAACLFIGRRRV